MKLEEILSKIRKAPDNYIKDGDLEHHAFNFNTPQFFILNKVEIKCDSLLINNRQSHFLWKNSIISVIDNFDIEYFYHIEYSYHLSNKISKKKINNSN